MINQKTYIIAEAGVNHNGSLDLAMRLVDEAVNAGADAIKFQTFKTDKLVSKKAPKADYQYNHTKSAESQFDMIKKLELDEHAHLKIYEYCKEKGIEFLSTPFDIDSVNFLSNQLNISRLKISSGDITNAPLLLQAAKTNKPIILSTGMSTLGEIEEALSVLAFGYLRRDERPSRRLFKEAYVSVDGQVVLKNKVSLLHCTSEYPAPFEDVNLPVIRRMASAFDLRVGFSDHTKGISIPIAAVALGAAIIEKHFTLDHNLPGPDHKASLEPMALKQMIESIREVEKAMGHAIKIPAQSEIKNKSVARKSIMASRKIKKGEVFSEDNITIKRPGTGISPIYYWDVIGRVANKDYQEEEMVIL